MRLTYLLFLGSVLGWLAGSPVVADEAPGWLGVQIAPVPPATSAQLNLEGRGVMVFHVVNGSPAYKAGLQRFDIITQYGPDPIASVGQLIDRVRKTPIGTNVTLNIIRAGKERNIGVTLAAEPGCGQRVLAGKSSNGPSGASGQTCHKAPGVMKPKQPGEPADIARLFSGIFPPSGFGESSLWLGGKQPVEKFTVRIDRDGRILEVDGSKGAGLIVKRIQPAGNTEKVRERSYATVEALRTGDPEAYMVYRNAIGPRMDQDFAVRKVTSPAELGVANPQLMYQEHLKALEGELRELAQKSGGYGHWLQEKYDALARDLHDLQSRFMEHARQHGMMQAVTPGFPHSAAMAYEGPAIRFEVASDGKITVDLRGKESELTLHFDSAAQLKTRRPDLYQKYEAIEENHPSGAVPAPPRLHM